MLRSFHIPVIIGDTVFETLGVVTLPFQEVVGTDVLGVQEVGICKVYENNSHYQVFYGRQF